MSGAGGIPSWVRVGAKVVCIYECEHGPRLNEVCEVANVECDRHGCWLFIVGHDAWQSRDETSNMRHSYAVDNFRPLITRTAEQDISLFVHHLNDVRVDA